MAQQQTAQPYAQGGGYQQGNYPYPPSYSYYPARNYPYQQGHSKLLYPIILVVAGLLLVGFSFMHMEKVDQRIRSMAARGYDDEIAAVVFCDPCGGVSASMGDSARVVSDGKVMVVGTPGELRDLADTVGVKQVKYLGDFDSTAS